MRQLRASNQVTIKSEKKNMEAKVANYYVSDHIYDQVFAIPDNTGLGKE